MNCPYCNCDMIPNVDVRVHKHKKIIRYSNPTALIYIFCPECSRILALSNVKLNKDMCTHTYQEYRGKSELCCGVYK